MLFPLVVIGAEKPTTTAQKHVWVDLMEAGEGALGLKHWRQVNVADSTFRLEAEGGGVIVCTGKPTGVIRSAEVYENFLVEFEWRHMERDGMRANAGFFVWSDGLPAVGIPFSRSIEIQVANFDRDTANFTRHGDIFPIHGSRMTPDPRFAARGQRSLPLEFRAHGTAEWNHYRILCVDGVIQLEVNGKLVSGGYHINPRKGHLMIESEGGEVHFRKMRVLALKSSEAALGESQVARVVASGTQVRALYNGLDLDGWKVSEGGGFKVADWKLQATKGVLSKAVPERGVIQLDFVNPEPMEALPVRLGGKGLDIPIKKGGHRLEVNLGSGAAVLDGQAIGQLGRGGDLELLELGKRGYFSNVLHIVK
ncbi:3-keto-disaccharide hydrolase [Rubritalea tangerina]